MVDFFLYVFSFHVYWRSLRVFSFSSSLYGTLFLYMLMHRSCIHAMKKGKDSGGVVDPTHRVNVPATSLPPSHVSMSVIFLRDPPWRV